MRRKEDSVAEWCRKVQTLVERGEGADDGSSVFYKQTKFEGLIPIHRRPGCTWLARLNRPLPDTRPPRLPHTLPRASTDAMITWMVTRPLFAIGHPRSALWRIRQPLGGELALTRPVAEELMARSGALAGSPVPQRKKLIVDPIPPVPPFSPEPQAEERKKRLWPFKSK